MSKAARHEARRREMAAYLKTIGVLSMPTGPFDLDELINHEITKRALGRQHDAQMGNKPLVKRETERIVPPMTIGAYNNVKSHT